MILLSKETEGYHPLWVTNCFLKDAKYDSITRKLQIGQTTISALYVDCQWLDDDALRSILQLAKSGMEVVMKNWDIKQPGYIKDSSFQKKLLELKNIQITRAKK